MISSLKYLKSMKILIISNSRSGSTNLMKSISSYYDIPYIFEPFKDETPVDLEGDVVIKTLINQHTYEFFYHFAGYFDKVILLSRRDIIAMSESLYWVSKKWEEDNYDEHSDYHLSEYSFDENINITEERIYQKVKDRINKLERLSEELNIPLDYYEDIYYGTKTLKDTDIGLDMKFLDNTLKLRK